MVPRPRRLLLDPASTSSTISLAPLVTSCRDGLSVERCRSPPHQPFSSRDTSPAKATSAQERDCSGLDAGTILHAPRSLFLLQQDTALRLQSTTAWERRERGRADPLHRRIDCISVRIERYEPKPALVAAPHALHESTIVADYYCVLGLDLTAAGKKCVRNGAGPCGRVRRVSIGVEGDIASVPLIPSPVPLLHRVPFPSRTRLCACIEPAPG